MKAKELRIGNWVNRPSGDVKIIDLLTHRNEFGFHTELVGNVAGNIDTLEPIPLTEEWLLRFGFIKRDSNWVIPYTDREGFKYHHSVQFYDGEWIYSNDGSNAGCYTLEADISNVHQLQNLYYALTGEELEINH